jgi:membrane protein implicated in regulation of membrane protease activity
MEPQEPRSDLLSRLGTFFILVGLGLLILFVGSIIGKVTSLAYLLLSIAALFIGYLFRRRTPKRESSRFQTIRRMSERGHQRRQERQSKSKKK